MELEPVHIRFPRYHRYYPATLCGLKGGSVSWEHHEGGYDTKLVHCSECLKVFAEMRAKGIRSDTDAWGRQINENGSTR